MQKTLSIIGIILLVILGAVLGWWLRGFRPVIIDPVVQTDTLWLHDTVSITKPVPQTRWLHDTTYVAVTDTIHRHDTLYVPIPRETTFYSDSLYEAWVTGFRASLDSIHILQRTAVVEKVIYRDLRKRWGIGVQVGGTYLPKTGATPYVGIGISYNLITF